MNATKTVRQEQEKKALKAPPKSVVLARLREAELFEEIEAEEAMFVEREMAAKRWLR
jgi:hypothetical protein